MGRTAIRSKVAIDILPEMCNARGKSGLPPQFRACSKRRSLSITMQDTFSWSLSTAPTEESPATAPDASYLCLEHAHTQYRLCLRQDSYGGAALLRRCGGALHIPKLPPGMAFLILPKRSSTSASDTMGSGFESALFGGLMGLRHAPLRS